jgi:Methane oxygenase PmoA
MKHIIFAAFFFFATAPLRADDGVTIVKQKDSLDFKTGNSLVGRYHVGANAAKPYMWPLNAAGDIPVTRAWPLEKGAPKESTDHVHQKSVWFTHGDVIPEGVPLKQKTKGVAGVDFWSEGVNAGKTVCVEVGEPKNGAKEASISTRNEWQIPGGMKILDETRVVHLHELPGGGRLFVFDIDLFASVCPITFGDTKEGAMGVRVNDEIVVKNGGHFINAEGKIVNKSSILDAPIWGNPSDWCDYVGQVGGKTVGVAVFDDPNNKPRADWHARAYGLLAANPFGRNASGFPGEKGKSDLVKLAKGDHLKLRYGVLAHAGDTKEAKVAEAYEMFKKRLD